MKHKSNLLKTIFANHRLYLMALPMLILVTVFSYLPLGGWVMAFTDYGIGKSMFSGEFTGLKQFIIFFTQAQDAGYVLLNTLGINLITLAVNMTSACLFAILLNEISKKRIKKMVQSFSFFPYFVSWVITYSMFNTFLSQQSGVLNQLLVNLKIIPEGINFLGSPKYAWGVIIFVNFWKYIGYNSVIFLSAIAGISSDQYEAADIDGANRIQKIRHITLPSLTGTLVMLLILNAGWIFNSNFEQFNLFSNAGNWERMEVLDVYIYRYGLKLLDFSYATAVGVVKTFASLLMFFIVNFVAKRLNGRSLV